ncbi:Uncharacterised protein [Pseudescherichia vulneris]|nr:Uncharacterised protein [Pseudescherichia vulneris]
MKKGYVTLFYIYFGRFPVNPTPIYKRDGNRVTAHFM